MSFEAVRGEIAKLHARYDQTEAKLDQVLLAVERSRFTTIAVVVVVAIIMVVGAWIAKIF